MPKPHIFLSSTCYDLDAIRSELDDFLSGLGFEVINSQKKTFGVTPGLHSHDVCLTAVQPADFLLLIVGGRHGGIYIGSERSITNEEFRAAERLGIPRMVVVDRRVNDYRQTYKKNPSGDHSHIVEDPRVFGFIDYIASGSEDNWIQPFEDIGDIKKFLLTQFGHYLHLFSKSHRKKPELDATHERLVALPDPLNVDDVVNSIEERTDLRGGLKALHQLISKIVNDAAKDSSKSEKLKMLWVLGRYGQSDGPQSIRLRESTFKQYAWSAGRGRRVNEQIEVYDISAEYVGDEEGYELVVYFRKASEDEPIAWALQTYVKKLIAKHGENGEDLFKRADMRMFA